MTQAAASADERPIALLRPHWRLVVAAFLGWFLDAFDQVALLLVLPEIGENFDIGELGIVGEKPFLCVAGYVWMIYRDSSELRCVV